MLRIQFREKQLLFVLNYVSPMCTTFCFFFVYNLWHHPQGLVLSENAEDLSSSTVETRDGTHRRDSDIVVGEFSLAYAPGSEMVPSSSEPSTPTTGNTIVHEIIYLAIFCCDIWLHYLEYIP